MSAAIILGTTLSPVLTSAAETGNVPVKTNVSTTSNSSVSKPITMISGEEAVAKVASNLTDGGGGGQKNVTDWMLSAKYKYSKKAEKFTVGSISIAVSALIPWRRVAVVTGIANLYYQMNTRNIYTTRLYYFKYKKGAHGSLLPYKEKVVIKFYKDKKRTKKIKTVSRITKK